MSPGIPTAAEPPGQPELPLPPRRAIALAVAGLALAVALVYSNSFAGPFIFDDLLSIPQNPSLGSLAAALHPPGGGLTVTGRPLLNLSFALNRALGGQAVWSYHAVNLLIHVLAALTLFGVVRRTLTPPAPGAATRIRATPRLSAAEALVVALGTALLWSLHPLQTESVTYVVQRAESLMGLLYLFTLYAFIRGALQPDADTVRRAVWFSLAAVACLLGMAAKEVMVSAPVIVLLYDRTFLAGSFGAAWRRRWPVHLALAATWAPLAILVVSAANRGGSAGFGVGMGFWAYLATQFQALAHYLWLSFWPSPLIIDYGAQGAGSPWEILPYAAVIIALAAGTAVALVRRPALGFLGAWFFAILAPSSLVPIVRQTLAEHRMYLPLAALAVLVALGLRTSLGRRGWLVAAIAAAGLGCLTVRRNVDYRSSESIWRDTVAKRPGNAYARNNYGNLLAQTGRPAEALAQYEAAIRLMPDYAEVRYNAGNVLRRLGRLTQAISSYEQALRLDAGMPDAETALGAALEDAGRDDEAVAHYERALRLDPQFGEAHDRLGAALARAGHPQAAIGHFEQALASDPTRSDVHVHLGNALGMAGRLREATAQYETAVRLDPESVQARHSLGNALREADRLPEAVAQYEQALKLDPRQPAVHNDLGMVLLVQGRTADAIAHFEAALRIDPRLAPVHLNLAIALQSVGRTEEAAAHYEIARRLGLTLPDTDQ